MRSPRSVASVALLVSLAACDQSHAAPPSPTPATRATAPSSGPIAPREGIHWMLAPAGLSDAASAISDARATEQASGRTLLVYVGATWCEPCQRFHHAVERGELDAAFPRLSVLAFDADSDGAALGSAGYASRLIPLFALPLSDGRSSGKQIEGSVKGEAAVGQITPRLLALVNGGT